MSQLDLFAPPHTTNHVDSWWLAGCLEAIRTLAATGRTFQAHDLITDTGLAEPDNHHWWGTAFLAAKREGLIVRAGYAPSKRPTVRGSACAEWRAA
jgi:hypothetical protein